jgi:dihydrofolate synthase/folylpolyglutamate synthase
VFTAPNAEGHGGRPPAELAQAARNAGLDGTACDSLEAALRQASACRPARVLICGSLYLAGEVLALNGELPD